MVGHVSLVGGFNPEKYWSNWIISPSRGENTKCLKPPPRSILYQYITIYLNCFAGCFLPKFFLDLGLVSGSRKDLFNKSQLFEPKKKRIIPSKIYKCPDMSCESFKYLMFREISCINCSQANHEAATIVLEVLARALSCKPKALKYHRTIIPRAELREVLGGFPY